jgi:hypothetical protein
VVATLTFASGVELVVTDDAPVILERIEAAQRSGGADLPAGWIMLTASESNAAVAVQTAQIAWIGPSP